MEKKNIVKELRALVNRYIELLPGHNMIKALAKREILKFLKYAEAELERRTKL